MIRPAIASPTAGDSAKPSRKAGRDDKAIDPIHPAEDWHVVVSVHVDPDPGLIDDRMRHIGNERDRGFLVADDIGFDGLTAGHLQGECPRPAPARQIAAVGQLLEADHAVHRTKHLHQMRFDRVGGHRLIAIGTAVQIETDDGRQFPAPRTRGQHDGIGRDLP